MRKIKAEFEGKEIDLELRGRVVVVRGDSATGKTYLCEALKIIKVYEQSKNKDCVYSNMSFINYNTDDIESKLFNNFGDSSKIVFIDNADIVLTKKDCKIIDGDSKTYVVFGRDVKWLRNDIRCVAELKIENNRIYLSYVMDRFNIKLKF